MREEIVERDDGVIDLVEQVSRKIQNDLHGLGPQAQGAILAELFALYLAGHMGPGAKEVREGIIETWLDTVRKLVPVNEAQILARTPEGGHA
jgi:hypothetical protein